MNVERFALRHEARGLYVIDCAPERPQDEAMILCRLNGDGESPVVQERGRYLVSALNYYASAVEEAEAPK